MLSESMTGRRATTIAEVVDIMEMLDRELSDADGLWWFNRLYLRVTLAVRSAVTTTTFRDPAFLERLDVVFANLYFDAVAAGDADPLAAPSAWRPLFESRHQRGILSIQFALAGMNAHINRDLPAGIVATYLATDGAPGHTGARYADFEKVNDLLESGRSADQESSFQPASWGSSTPRRRGRTTPWRCGRCGRRETRRGRMRRCCGRCRRRRRCATRSSRGWTASRASRAVDSWSAGTAPESEESPSVRADRESRGDGRACRSGRIRPEGSSVNTSAIVDASEGDAVRMRGLETPAR